jgi:hypothetical protein
MSVFLRTICRLKAGRFSQELLIIQRIGAVQDLQHLFVGVADTSSPNIIPMHVTPALGPTQPPVQWIPVVFSPGVKRGRGVTLTTHLI